MAKTRPRSRKKRRITASERRIVQLQIAIDLLEAGLSRAQRRARAWRDKWVEAQHELGVVRARAIAVEPNNVC